MATSISLVFPCHVLYASLLLLCLIISSKQGYAFQGRKAPESHHVLHDYPSTACERTTKDYPISVEGHTTTLEVVHRYGPCSTRKEDKMKSPSLAEDFRRDQLRVDWIHSRFSKASSDGNDDGIFLRAYDGVRLDSSNYFTVLQLGTPSILLTLGFDTGTPLTWTQCQPCTGNCYNQIDQIFNPSKSTSYANISCSSPVCTSLPSQGIKEECTNGDSTCMYNVTYGDGSKSAGYLSKDKLTLAQTEVFNDFVFGCGQANQGGRFGRTDGLLGLSRGNISFIEQTASKYKKIFSYCLPSTSRASGFLTFGGSPSNSTKFTPLSNSSSPFYAINITGISVNGSQLNISSSVFSTGAIIDTGTTITRLPPAAYSALQQAFMEKMPKKYLREPPPTPLLDTCYSHYDRYEPIQVPNITFSFTGGVNLDVVATGAVVEFDANLFCLAFAANNDTNSPAILGSKIQQTYEVFHDVGGGRLSFVPQSCR